jgi:hypothetical protein
MPLHAKIWWTHLSKTDYPYFQTKRESNRENFNRVIYGLVDNPQVWNDSVFLEDVNAFLSAAFEEADLYFANLEREAGSSDPKRLAALMSEKRRSPNFFVPFFNASFFHVYHMARNNISIAAHSFNPDNYILPPSFNEIDQTPFFTPDTAQFEWREMYNILCSKVHSLGVLPYLDPQFTSWTKLDDGYFSNTDKPWDLRS